MKGMPFVRRVLGIALVAGGATLAAAGPYSDSLGKCLVDSSTTTDRQNLVRWMFAAASAHPAVASLAKISEGQRDLANRDVAEMMTRLMTTSCKDEMKKALRYEGQAATVMSFNVLGQVAGQELFSSPEVAGVLGGLEKHFDVKKLEAALKDE